MPKPKRETQEKEVAAEIAGRQYHYYYDPVSTITMPIPVSLLLWFRIIY